MTEQGFVEPALNRSEARGFWHAYQPGFRLSDQPPGTPSFFQEVEARRYQLEPHIPEIVEFDRWRGLDVLEVGCGIGTDGIRFARSGARYVGVDSSQTALDLARSRFAIERVAGDLRSASATRLPFGDAMFDLVYSHGVIHHIANTRQAVAELRRVLRPGGTAIVMLYHRRSLNYHLNIMGLRRALAATLVAPGGTKAVARLTGEPTELLEGHRQLLAQHGWRYLLDRDLFLSNNTDGPGNPLSKAYTRVEAVAMFAGFDAVETRVRFLNARLLPGGDALSRSAAGKWLERRAGWHLYVIARCGPGATPSDS